MMRTKLPQNSKLNRNLLPIGFQYYFQSAILLLQKMLPANDQKE